MKIITEFLIVILFVMVAHSGFASEMFVMKSTQGKVPITIDGENSDWDYIQQNPIKIEKINIWSKPGRPRDIYDLSATFRCFKDIKNLYVFISVLDDQLIFGEAPFGKLYQDDAIEIILYNSQAEPLKIWVSMNSKGETKLEGREPQSQKSYPFLKKTLGIKSVLLKNSNGYSVETGIPMKVIESLGWKQDNALKMNIRVYDDDDWEQCESVLEWSGNPAEPYKDSLNEIKFLNSVPQNYSTEQLDDKIGEYNEVEIILGEPSRKIDPENYENRLGIALAIEKKGDYAEAIEKLKIIIRECDESTVLQKSKLALGMNYFFIGDYENARKICTDLINSDVDSKILLDSQMILLSIEQTKSKP